MNAQFNENHTKIINELLELVDKKINPQQAGIVRQFVEYYYATVADYDLQARHILDLYGAVLSHWALFSPRQADECKIHVFNPQYEQHGWQSSHTVIQIVHRDMPFLVDSTRMELARHGITVHLLINPGAMAVKRDKQGEVMAISPVSDNKNEQGFITEAPLYYEIDQQVDEQSLQRIKQALLHVLGDVQIVIDDWKPMLEKANTLFTEVDKAEQFIDKEEFNESKDFIHWVADENFTFLGYCEYELYGKKGHESLKVVDGTGLGLLRNNQNHHADYHLDISSPQAKELARSSNKILNIQQLSKPSPVHRPSAPYCIGIKRFNSDGNVIGEWRFIGLYTSIAYHSTPTTIPFLRLKTAKILKESKLPYKGHSWKSVVNILETFPRDELFQMHEDELREMVMGIFYMQERSCIRLFMRKDPYNRFYSCLVYVPRDQFNSPLRQKLAGVLCEALQGKLESFNTYFSESVLARIHLIIKIVQHVPVPSINVRELEAKLVLASRNWRDDLKDALYEHFDEAKATHLHQLYGSAFPAGYREAFSARIAVYDIEHMESLSPKKPLAMSLYRPLEGAEGNVHFKLFCLNTPLPLSDILPLLENMGLRIIGEQSHQINVTNSTVIWISDFSLRHKQEHPIEVDAVRTAFQDAFACIWRNDAENDGFNQLVLTVGLTWREVCILRAYAKYLRQVGFTFSQTYIQTTLAKYPDIIKGLVNLFHLRFDPKLHFDPRFEHLHTEQHINEQRDQVISLLDAVDSLDEDRILRRYLDLTMATLRTNFYQYDAKGQPKPYISYKLQPSAIPELPLPLPLYEIFVYSPRVEGVHLRAAKVARGGIRWSDRREDFRTEILGLMKAQQVKNSVIVPSGAKGGFIPKCLPATGSREEVMQEVIASYSIFIRGLLDLTDNRVGDHIDPPKRVVRHDNDDAYLVVAADKGTATFSDIANAIAAEYDFWLGDAFASGGSAGYDHKKMGITAVGCWESVKRHFREISIDMQKSNFTVVGIGDMSGDVFGNGLIYSSHIKLIAAFNHQHIFIDPNPDPQRSCQERLRLFNLPRSSWADYDLACISEGGGVYNRSAKVVKLSPIVCAVLDLNSLEVTTNELIRAILKAQIDLLWNGGIGTYIKASNERNVDVGDRTNDAVRVNGNEVRAKVLGEGGNLGVTQLGRTEYCFTDFIDNVGGVDCSDHEVNIKILLDTVVASSDLTYKQRNILLAEMTNEVGDLVIKDCYRQTQALSLAAWRAPATLDEYRRYIQSMERMGRLDRELNFLPEDEALADRKSKGLGLMRPELAVLLAFSKIFLKEDLLTTDIPEDEYLRKELVRAFPARLAQLFPDQMKHHRLHREIIATQLSNSITNQMGPTFVRRLYDETGASARDVVRAFIVSKDIFDMDTYWRAIEALDDKVNPIVQMRMMTDLARLLRRATRWFLRNRRVNLNISAIVAHFAPKIAELRDNLSSLLVGAELEKTEKVAAEYQQQGVPIDLAWSVAIAGPMVSAMDIIEAASTNNCPVTEVAQAYFALGAIMQLDWFRSEVENHPVRNNWDALARAACKDDLDKQQRNLTDAIFRYRSGGNFIDDCITQWMHDHQVLVDRWYYVVADLKATTVREFSVFSVALRELADLAQASLTVTVAG